MISDAQIQRHDSIRCVVVHEMTLLRQGLRRLLEDEPGLEVAAEAANAAEALRQVLEHRPEVVITDPTIFGCSPAQAEQMVLRESPKSKVVFLPVSNRDETWQPACDHAKYMERQTSAEDLVTIIRGTAERIASPVAEVSEFPLDEMASRKRVLTAREREVLKLLAEGRTVRAVAAILGLSIKTVDAHKFNLMRKLGIHNKTELVIWAIQKKVVKLPVNL